MISKIKRFKNISDFYKFQIQIHKADLKNSIKKRILLRLVVAGLLIAIVLASAVFFIEFQRLGRLVNGRAEEIVTRFNEQIRHLLDEEPTPESGLQQDLDTLLIAGKTRQWMGRLVYSSIYDIEGRQICTATDSQYAHMAIVDGLVRSMTHRLPKNLKSEHEFKRVNGVPYILLAFPLTNSTGERAAVIEGIFAVSARASDEVLERILSSVFGAMAIVALTTLTLYPVIITLVRQLSTLAGDLLESNIETLRVIGSAIAKRDSDTDSHNYRVTIYSVILAERIGLQPKLIRGLIKGAFLHDVGKIGVSDQILLKPGKLSENEFEEIKLHVLHGLDIVKRSAWLKDAVDVVGYHHEKFAGKGYPYGLSGSKIPENARCFAIADVFDALSSGRPYKKPLSFDQALEVLSDGRESHFDPFYLDTFVTIAKSLYDDFSDCPEQKLYLKMESLIQKYFSKEFRFDKEGGI